MSITALHLYEQLTEASDDRSRAKVIAEAFGQLEERYPQLGDIATQGHLRETELRLQKEIKETEARLQKEMKETEARLQKEMRETEARLQKEIREIEAKLQKELREIDARLQKEIEKTRLEIREVEIRLTQAIHRQTLWTIGSIGAILGAIRLLEWILGHWPPQ